MVTVTWRDEPAPTGVLAEVAELLARRHALRPPLTGLDAERRRPHRRLGHRHRAVRPEAEALRRRTDGNPFFLVECARLARERGDLGELLADANPPAAVQDVLLRRVGALPEATSRALRTASVGRPPLRRGLPRRRPRPRRGRRRSTTSSPHWRPGCCARTASTASGSRTRSSATPSTARSRGLVPGASTPGSRRPCATGASARPRWPGTGWPPDRRTPARPGVRASPRRTAPSACSPTRRRPPCSTTPSPPSPPTRTRRRWSGTTSWWSTPRACSCAGNWVDLRPTVHRAIHAAHELDDLDRLVHAATLSLDGALWQASTQGGVDPFIIGALRDALDRLPPGDSDPRCRVMIALAGEIYYASTPQEREALADEAVAMADRLGDPALRLWACLTAATSIWRAANGERRFELVDEACGRGPGAGRPDGPVLGAHPEGGGARRARPDRGDGRAASARPGTRPSAGGTSTPSSCSTPWRSRGWRWAGTSSGSTSCSPTSVELGEQMLLPMYEHTVAGSLAMKLLWTGEHDKLLQVLHTIEEISPLPVQSFIAAIMCRIGRPDEARDYLSTRSIEMDVDTWFSPLMWAMAAETGLYLERPELAAAAYAQLVGLAGRPASTGSAAALGPVDAFLALAAAATGEWELATQHADDALGLCERWGIPLVARWLTDVRGAYGF